MDAERLTAQPALLSLPGRRVLPWARWPLFSLVALLPVLAFFGATYHPRAAPLRGPEADKQIAAIFGLPKGHDGVLRGDYLIERFYAVDAETGDRYVADLCKGRVVDVVASTRRPDGLGSYMVVLDRENLQPERDRLQAYSAKVAPVTDSSATYLGLRVQGGGTDAFALNYSGVLPKRYSTFHGPHGSDVYSFLVHQAYGDISSGSRVIDIRETNYLLSSTALFPYFRNGFQINKAVFVSQLLFLDATSPAAKDAYQEIAQRIPMRP